MSAKIFVQNEFARLHKVVLANTEYGYPIQFGMMIYDS